MTPAVTHCPYCGAGAIKFVGLVPRCTSCRAVFHLMFSRYVRAYGRAMQGVDIDRVHKQRAGVAQSVEQRPRKPPAAGSKPAASTKDAK